MPKVPRYFQVLTTTNSVEEARDLSRAVLESRFAACVQIVGPIESHYWWNGGIERATEWLCIIKTTEPGLDSLLSKLRAIHSYSVPELTATEIVAGDASYLEWISKEVAKPLKGN